MGEDHWVAYERSAPLDGDRDTHLIFHSAGAVRRVRDFPADWFDLSDEELFALSWRR